MMFRNKIEYDNFFVYNLHKYDENTGENAVLIV